MIFILLYCRWGNWSHKHSITSTSSHHQAVVKMLFNPPFWLKQPFSSGSSTKAVEFPFHFGLFHFSLIGKKIKVCCNCKYLVLVPVCSYVIGTQFLLTIDVLRGSIGNKCMYFFECSLVVFVIDQHVKYLVTWLLQLQQWAWPPP